MATVDEVRLVFADQLVARHQRHWGKEQFCFDPVQATESAKLPTMLSESTKVASRCATENVDHLGFLLQLCELELIDRERRAADRRFKAAKFPTHKTLETFDFVRRARRQARQGSAVGQQAADHRTGPRRVHRQAGEPADRRQLGNRQEPSGHRAGHHCLRPGQARAVHPCDRVARSPCAPRH